MSESGGLNRRQVLAAAGGGALAASALTATAKPRGRREAPYNILMIINDQERSFADLPSSMSVPAHEWLRARGVSFANHHVNTSPCGPSRSVIYTGQHTQKTGVYVNPNTPPYPQLKPQTPTIGHMLRQAGYYTAYKGKWHITNIEQDRHAVAEGVFANTEGALEPFGFSNYNFNGDPIGLTWQGFREDGVTAAEAVNQIRAFRDGAAGDKPWFMAVNFVNPHDVMFFDATGKGEQTRLRPNLISPLSKAPGDPIYDADWKQPLPRSFYQDDLSTKPAAHRAINSVMWAFYGRLPHADEASWQAHQNYYFNCIRDANRHVMTVLDALQRTGQLDRTIIVFTSDHGERAGAHGMRQKGGTIYKEDLRTPLVVVHPDVKGGRTTEALASSVDLAPTLLAMAGVTQEQFAERHPQLKGHDLMPALASPQGRSKRDEDGILFNYAIRYGWNAADAPAGVEFAKPLAEPDLKLRRLFRGAFDGRYKYARYFAPAEHHRPTTWEALTAHNDLELYDTAKDPDEIVNLAAGPNADRNLILRLNSMTNALISAEVGQDDGSEYPGPTSQYNTLKT